MTNQERISAGLELSFGEGERRFPLEHQPKFIVDGTGGPTHILPTVRFRALPKSERMGRRQYLKSEKRFNKVFENRQTKHVDSLNV